MWCRYNKLSLSPSSPRCVHCSEAFTTPTNSSATTPALTPGSSFSSRYLFFFLPYPLPPSCKLFLITVIHELFLQEFRHESVFFYNSGCGSQYLIKFPFSLLIFRPYFIWKRKIFKSNGFFTNLAKNLFISKLKGFTHRIQLM